MTGVADPAVRIFYPARTETIQSLHELATVVRSVVEIRRGFTFDPGRAAVMRGTPDEIAAAEWLFNELDQRDEAHAASDMCVCRGWTA